MKRTVLRDVGLPSLLAIGFVALDLILDRLTGARDEFISPHLVLAAVVLIISFTLFRRAASTRARAEAVLVQARDELEDRVRERTVELEKVNERLEAEIAERRQAEATVLHLSSFPGVNPNPVLEINSSGSIVYRNPSVVRFLEMQGSLDERAFIPTDLPSILQDLKAKKGATIQREVRIGKAYFLETLQVLPEFDVVRIYAYETTELKRIEENLRQSEERFRLVLKNAPVTVAAQDLDLRYIWAYNQRTDAPESVIGKTDSDLFPADTAARLVELKRRVLATGSEVRAQMWVDSGGHNLFVDLYIQPIRNESGAVAGIGVATVDLTELKHAEKALRIERDRAESYLNVAGVMIAAVDTDQRVSLINAKGCQVLRRSEAEILGANWYDAFVPARFREGARAAFVRALDADLHGFEHSESTIFTPDGEERLIEWHNVALRDGAGHITGTLSSGEDVTDRRRDQEALRGSEEKFSRVFHASPDALCIVNAADGTFVDVNDAFTELLGYERSEVLERTSRQLGLVPSTEGGANLIKMFREHGPVSDVELDVTTGSGSVMTMLVSLVPIQIDEEPCALVIAHDITLRKQSEIALRVAQQELASGIRERSALEERQRLARELHDSVSQALYGVSLGVNTAITLFDTDRPKVREALDYALQLSHAGLVEMRSLIFELRPESLAAEGLVAALTKHAEALRARHGIEVELSLGCEPDVPLSLTEGLYRITREALQNAIKHSRSGRVDVRLTCEPDGLRLEVCDNGVGFDPDAVYPGHLGLQSMRERAQGLGGTLEIVSSPDCGTEVHVFLPVPDRLGTPVAQPGDGREVIDAATPS